MSIKVCSECRRELDADLWFAKKSRQVMASGCHKTYYTSSCYECRYADKPKPDTAMSYRFTIAQAAYLAGLIDADGHVRLAPKHSPHSHDLRVTVTNTDFTIMEWLKEVTGGFIYLDSVKPLRKHELDQRRDPARWKERYVAVFTCRRAFGLLHAIRPYLIIKAARADLAFEYEKTILARGCRIYPALAERREGILQQMNALNKRGVSH